MLFWLGGVVLFGLLFLVLFLTNDFGSESAPPNDRRIMLLAPPGMFVFGIALVWFGRILGRSEERRLLAFAGQLWGPAVGQGIRESDSK